MHLRYVRRDPERLAEAKRLYGEVIAEYGEVVYRTVKHRELEALAASQEPRWNGRLLTGDELDKLKTLVARKQTLAEAARARLDDMENLVEGKPAPEIDGVDLAGKPLKLSDYRGKINVLILPGETGRVFEAMRMQGVPRAHAQPDAS